MFSFNNNTATRTIDGFSRCVTLCAKHAALTIAITGLVFMLTPWRKCP